MKNNALNMAMMGLILVAIPLVGEAQARDGYSASFVTNYDPYYDHAHYDNRQLNGNPLDYHDSYSTNRRYQSYSLGKSFDNSDNFSSGISSYQGTSTGPGPNGGYPGAPRGVYPTHYVDTSIYPNSYMNVQSR